jgi:alpha 1,2-mannosyltransferase
MLETIQNVEDRFNSQFHYDWVFLNDEEFNDEFKTAVRRLASGRVKFGKISQEHWSLPEWIDKELMHSGMESLKGRVIYGDLESYRHMCRWYSGFFQWHEILLGYKYYWRVEPGVKYFCDIPYDVFKFMRENRKKYGFTISIYEYTLTIPTLFETIARFFNQPEQKDLMRLMPQNNLHEFIMDKDGNYNLCHYWTNFEIADLDFFRSEAYIRYFKHVDKEGGFFYERWGDGPVRSIFISLFLSKDEIMWFNDIGYMHPPYIQCPVDLKTRARNRCTCDPSKDFTFHDYSCTRRFINAIGI